MSRLTKEQALALAETGWWNDMAPREVAAFQLAEDRLCMPFGDFHKAVEDALGRPVFTHEFACPTALIAEMSGEVPAPSLAKILAKLPAEKTIVLDCTAASREGAES